MNTHTVHITRTRTHITHQTSHKKIVSIGMGSGVLSLTIALFCIGGVAISYYAIHIEHMKSEDVSYKAACDLDEKIACSKVVTSK